MADRVHHESTHSRVVHVSEYELSATEQLMATKVS